VIAYVRWEFTETGGWRMVIVRRGCRESTGWRGLRGRREKKGGKKKRRGRERRGTGIGLMSAVLQVLERAPARARREFT